MRPAIAPDGTIELTAAQRTALEWAERVADGLISDCVAVMPRHGQHSMFQLLRKRGLFSDAGRGVDRDDHMREVDLYAITDAGRRALATKGEP